MMMSDVMTEEKAAGLVSPHLEKLSGGCLHTAWSSQTRTDNLKKGYISTNQTTDKGD